MTTVRLVGGVGPPDGIAKGLDGQVGLPALLVSYWYLKGFQRERPRYRFRDWIMDSGAYSAANSGASIDGAAYLDTCQQLLASDPQLVEVFSLDVMDDPEASLRAAEDAWAQGVPAIPTFHYGEPWHYLEDMARRFPKISIGGMVPVRGAAKKRAFVEQVFARAWPARIHGLGLMTASILRAFPFHSVDASNWEMAPCAFGTWKAFNGAQLSIRGSAHNLRAEVEWHLGLERELASRWGTTLAGLDQQLTAAGKPWPVEGPAVRLSVNDNPSAHANLQGTTCPARTP